MISSPLSFRVSPNGRYFIDQRGEPYFFLGDTEWELFRKYSADEATQILNRRKSQGFNTILVMLMGIEMERLFPERESSHANLHGELPWEEDDPLRPNPRYFEHIDSMIRLGEQTGMNLVVGIYHQWHNDRIHAGNARAWARWVANRYRDVPNLVWSMYPRAEESYVPVCRELAAGLQEGDGGSHLISVHPDPSVASSSFMHAEPWLAFNMIQTCIDYEKIVETVSADYHLTPVKPVVMAEGGYEGVEFERLQTEYEIRQQAYWSQLAGGYHVYGHNDSWQHPQKWKEWIGAPGAENMHVFRKVITSLPEWWQAVPDQSVIQQSQESGSGINTAFRADDWSWVMIYLSHPCRFSLNLPVKGNFQRIKAAWIDPRDGGRTTMVMELGEEYRNFTTPADWQDSLFLLEI